VLPGQRLYYKKQPAMDSSSNPTHELVHKLEQENKMLSTRGIPEKQIYLAKEPINCWITSKDF